MTAEHNEHRIFGPPGTGKTTTLAAWVTKAAERYGTDRVIVASFTRAAAAEIGGRDLPLPPESVGTLHAHAYRALGGKIDIAEAHLDDWNNAHPALALSRNDNSSKTLEAGYEPTAGATDTDVIFLECERLRAMMIPPERWPYPVALFAKAWNEWKAASNLLDFTDLISNALAHTYTAPGRPTVGFFDEVQDFTRLELALIRKWGAAMDWGIVMAGDDDQCLYSFKGCTPDAFLDPPVAADHKRVLPQSYRVPRRVHAYASRWVEQLTRREPKEYRPREDDGRLVSVSYGVDEPQLADAVERHISDGKTVMILTTCAYMLNDTIACLRERAIPFHNPYRRTSGRWNPLHVSRGTSAAQRLLAFLTPQPDAWPDPTSAHMWTQRELYAWVQHIRAKDNLLPHVKEDLAAVCGRPGDGYIEVPIPGLLKMITEQALGHAMDGDVDWYGSQLLDRLAKTTAFPLAVLKAHGAAALRDAPKVTVGTIHSVKGGEADVVMVSPGVSSAGWVEWNSTAGRDAVIRQFYVGFTRAKEQLYILGQGNDRYSIPLPRNKA